MKKEITFALAAILLLGISLPAGAQMIVGTVDVEKIRDKSTRFKDAQKEIDEMVEHFDDEDATRREELENLAADLQDAAERNLSSTLDRLRREMADKSQDYQKFMEETFGTDGIIETKSSELLTPLYDDLAAAAKKVAQDDGIDLVLDLEQLSPLFSSDKIDVTDRVLEEFLKFQ